ncbi:hypothetical protein [Bifidobacterium thermophilum]|uniref:hypothetical protein n=1 Tax=Bifidobacterium thermophilum TaxID=33905 RepID=UPI003F93CA9C
MREKISNNLYKKSLHRILKAIFEITLLALLVARAAAEITGWTPLADIASALLDSGEALQALRELVVDPLTARWQLDHEHPRHARTRNPRSGSRHKAA